jgi:phytoene/squalene synthetase
MNSSVADPTNSLARAITYNASRQTGWTIQTLVPRQKRADAFRAYAYYRWVDDVLDGENLSPSERVSFLESQQDLLRRSLDSRPPLQVNSDERLLVALTQGPMGKDPGLRIYLEDMMAVMTFDAHRRGRRITQAELQAYSRRLATAVSEAVYTFIGEECQAPRIAQRYLAADAAHIIHMLRDMHEDLEAGYVNIPLEVLPGDQIKAADLVRPEVQIWVQERVQTARAYFEQGEAYLALVDNPRCRVAGALYARRFLEVIEAIEREDYLLRRDYSDCKRTRAYLRMLIGAARMLLRPPSIEQLDDTSIPYEQLWEQPLEVAYPKANQETLKELS